MRHVVLFGALLGLFASSCVNPVGPEPEQVFQMTVSSQPHPQFDLWGAVDQPAELFEPVLLTAQNPTYSERVSETRTLSVGYSTMLLLPTTRLVESGGRFFYDDPQGILRRHGFSGAFQPRGHEGRVRRPPTFYDPRLDLNGFRVKVNAQRGDVVSLFQRLSCADEGRATMQINVWIVAEAPTDRSSVLEQIFVGSQRILITCERFDLEDRSAFFFLNTP